MSHRIRSPRPLQLDEIEVFDEAPWTPRAPGTDGRSSRRPGRFPPAISDAELARLVDECAAELCVPQCYEAFVY